LMIQILQNKGIGLYVAEAAAEVIAANARFNLWVLNNVKNQGANEDRWIRLLDSCEEVHHQCEAAVDTFIASRANEDLSALHAANETLRAALLAIRQKLDGLRD
jgi:hypothetical protein